MTTLQDILSALLQPPSSLGNLDLSSFLAFIQLSCALKDVIRHSSSIQHARSDGPPPLLPAHICAFIAQRLALTLEQVDMLWSGLCTGIWALEPSSGVGRDVEGSWNDSAMFDALNQQYHICEFILQPSLW